MARSLVIPRGRTWSVGWQTTVDLGDGAGLVDLPDDWEVLGQVRVDASDAAAVLEWSTSPTAGQCTAGISSGLLTIGCTPDQTEALTWTKAVYEVVAWDPTDAAGTTVTVDEGSIRLDHGVVVISD